MPKIHNRKRPRPAAQAALDPLAYRNRAGRTGLDPMDSYGEQGRFVGLLIRWLLRGRTRNPLLIAVLFVFGLPVIVVTLWGLIQPIFSLESWQIIPAAILLFVGFFAIVRAVDSLLALRRERSISARDKTPGGD